jgi:hypothetical protein
MYKVGIISEAHCTIPLVIPLIIPLCLESPSPVPESLLLTWNPSFACGAIPFHSGPRLLVYWPPSPPFPRRPFPCPQRFPISNMCPPTTTSRNRLHIVRYNNSQETFNNTLRRQSVTFPKSPQKWKLVVSLDHRTGSVPNANPLSASYVNQGTSSADVNA